MINNLLEMWYWSLMLLALIGIGIWRAICFVQYLWSILKNRKTEPPRSS